MIIMLAFPKALYLYSIPNLQIESNSLKYLPILTSLLKKFKK